MFSSLLTPVKRCLKFGRSSRVADLKDARRRSIRLMAKKDDVPWKLDEPFWQPCHSWSGGSWYQAWGFEQQHRDQNFTSALDRPRKLALYSWNIDFMLPFAESRMRAAIGHLHDLVQKQSPDTVSVILLAECVESDVELISSDSWVRDTFQLTDLDGTHWQSGHYGTMTLIDRRLPIEQCFRIHYSKSRMERDGLFVDIVLGGEKTVRLCNTHLESLALQPAFRPPQVQLCASYMHDPAVSGAILAGDLNAIEEFDKHLHSDNGLKDAYLELGGEEDDAKGHTWGQQAATHLRDRFGTTRMDKIFFRGDLLCSSFELFGQGIEVTDVSEREDIVGMGFDKPWITDHFGIKGLFEI